MRVALGGLVALAGLAAASAFVVPAAGPGLIFSTLSKSHRELRLRLADLLLASGRVSR